jgi:hypothetical protein
MSNYEFEYNNEDFELIADTTIGELSDFDFVRITVYPIENVDNIVQINGQRAIFYSSLSEAPFRINQTQFSQKIPENEELDIRLVGGDENDFPIYKNPDLEFNNVFIKPNEAFNNFGLPQGNYRIQIDFLNQVAPPAFSGEYLSTLPFPHYFEEFDFEQDNILDSQDLDRWTNVAYRSDIAHYVSRVINNEIPEPPSAVHGGAAVNPPEYYINPLASDYEEIGEQYQFIVRQISTSRTEVRLELKNHKIREDSIVISDLTELFNTDNNGTVHDNYQFKHMLNIGNGNHIPILNYHFDNITAGKEDQSLILKLYDPLPTFINNLHQVTIEKEVLTTQIEETYYFSDVPEMFFGDGLIPDAQESWINPDNNNFGYQNYNELTQSLDMTSLKGIISQSQYQYPNLNTDFTKFENHTFFGSAKRKIVNFKNKIETIQGYYAQISSSLSSVGEATVSSSTFLKQKRQNLFRQITTEINSFTPYERFLYYDGQSESTASAPGLGKNYADAMPVQTEGGTTNILNNYDGFDTVYERLANVVAESVNLFGMGKYKVHEKPFFNHSGSIYLSFIAKGSVGLGGITSSINQHVVTGMNINGFQLPYDTVFTSSINPVPTGSEYKRFIFEESRSYFMPSTPTNDMAELSIVDFGIDSAKIMVLSGSVKTGSVQMKDTTGVYPTTVVSESSAIPFFGSVMPAGNLFNLAFQSSSANLRELKIADIKVTLNNPTNVLPFDNLFHTSSADWIDWYNTTLTNAETFDTDNIHSFENNLPLYIQESSQFNDMKDFLALQGEQYDLIRNHIDSMGTLHKRGYKKTDSPPNNTLPILLSNMGWEAINPFTGSLNKTLGPYLSGVTSIDDIKNNTWRKTLNNLLYIYKSKGTKNSVRALLNTYGYPPDVLNFQEFGGANNNNESITPKNLLSDNFPINPANQNHPVNDINLETQTGSFGFTTRVERMYSHIFRNDNQRILNLDWWMDSADINSFEFVYKHANTTNTQTILESSGSADETLWDLRLVPSSDGRSGSFAFRLNKSLTGSLAIATNAFSMSSDFVRISDGQLWNVMLQRMTQSLSGTGTNQYKLHVSEQKGQKINTYSIVSMSISGGFDDAGATKGGRGFYANQNWFLTGSRHYLTSSNLVVGKTMTGSLSEIKSWNTALSVSKFRHHTLNKFSTIGNNINSHRKELVYHFKLNENYSTSSISASNQMLTIVDSAPKTTLTTDYSFKRTGSLYTGSVVYGVDTINTVRFSTQDNFSKENDKTIIINPKRKVVGDLSATNISIESLINPVGSQPNFNVSSKLELYRSPQSTVNDFILNNVDGFNFETLYGDPKYNYSQSYGEFDTFRKDFFEAHPIRVDVNKFVRAHENMFNHSIIEGMKTLVPARSTFNDKNANIGVEIKPTILEKQKYENELHSVEVNPNTATGSVNILSIKQQVGSSSIKTIDTIGLTLSNSEFEKDKKGTITLPLAASSSLVLPHSASISMGNAYSESVGYIHPRFLQPNGYTASIVNPYSASVSILSTKESIFNNNTISASKGIKGFRDTVGINFSGSTVVLPHSGTIDYASIANESFVDVHKNWGTSSSDVHHINYYGGTGSRGDYNTYAIETRVVFNAIGDHEYYSSSAQYGGTDDFSNSSRFYNRLYLSNDLHGKVNYDSKEFATGTGIITGRMMGKTRYFATSSDGEMILPSNHVTKFSNPFKDRMYAGTQNTKPGNLNFQHEDYSTSSFYRVKVTGGETSLKVQSGKGSLDNDDRIIY